MPFTLSFVLAFLMAVSISSSPVASVFSPLMKAMGSVCARSSNVPERFSTSTELSLTLLVCSPEATMPTMLITMNTPMTIEKSSIPTTVASTYLKKSFIIVTLIYLEVIMRTLLFWKSAGSFLNRTKVRMFCWLPKQCGIFLRLV